MEISGKQHGSKVQRIFVYVCVCVYMYMSICVCGQVADVDQNPPNDTHLFT